MSHYTVYKVATFFGTAILPTLVYGINSTLIFMTLRLLWGGQRAGTRKLLMTSYVGFLCALCTAHWALSCIVEALELVEVILLSNNPSLELADRLDFKASYATLGVEIIYIILTWLTDGLLVRVDV